VDKAPALLENIKTKVEVNGMTNTPAFYDMSTIMVVKSIVVQAPGGCMSLGYVLQLLFS
jgi:hypothetical protein